MRLILSPVGTGIFTHLAASRGDLPAVDLLHKYANSSKADSPPELRALVAELSKEVEKIMETEDRLELRHWSAELNGIIGVYDGQLPPHSEDMHFLVLTDTIQGEAAGSLIRSFLQKHFPAVELIRPRGLSTRNKEDFLQGVKDLLQWCDETLPAYHDHDFEIVFNLTGGFRSLQGYLHTIGTFYADHIIYRFEAGEEIIHIPKIPVRLESEFFERHASLFLRLSQAPDGLALTEASELPRIMLDIIDDRCLLSAWGRLAWDHVKGHILAHELVSLPMIAYEDSFRHEFRKTQLVKDKVRLQETVAHVSTLLQLHGGDIAALKGGRGGGLLYDNYTGQHKHLGHFRLGQGPRVSCQYVERVLHLRHFGPHDHVNENP